MRLVVVEVVSAVVPSLSAENEGPSADVARVPD